MENVSTSDVFQLPVEERIRLAKAFHARDWYESQLDGLGHRFVDELDLAIQKAHRNPRHYQIVHRENTSRTAAEVPLCRFFHR